MKDIEVRIHRHEDGRVALMIDISDATVGVRTFPFSGPISARNSVAITIGDATMKEVKELADSIQREVGRCGINYGH